RIELELGLLVLRRGLLLRLLRLLLVGRILGLGARGRGRGEERGDDDEPPHIGIQIARPSVATRLLVNRVCPAISSTAVRSRTSSRTVIAFVTNMSIAMPASNA